MVFKIYIERQIKIDSNWEPESRLISDPGVSVILAEPGAGKTDLLQNLATNLNTVPIRANLFRHQTRFDKLDVLIIDALDEVAKIDQTAGDAILVKAFETGARKVIFASRSAQWEEARTKTLKQCFGQNPQIVRLRPFVESEQQELFVAYKPGKDFVKFQTGLHELGLDGLLGNPQFLKMFADAFEKRGGNFESKQQIFSDSLEQLAREVNEDVSQRTRPPVTIIAERADEVFAKLLVAGSMDLSRFSAAPSTRLSHLSFKSQRAFPT